ncbi:MAG TPA: histidine phosphatase family protein, partial [Cupriavidus sp.]|nr:histidine phosphatase family protein [Cupriavidus sp.]
MATLFLVRHGQASFGAANYDCLSDTGRQQSRWLGEYFRDRGVQFRRVVAGTL